MDDNHSPNEEEEERPRPRVIDKRVTSRPAPPAAETRAEKAPEPTAAAESHVEQAPLTSTPSPTRPPETAEPGPQQVWTPEREAEAQQIADEIGRVPATDWVLSTVMTLVNVASVKLEQADSEGSQLAIDALAGIIDSVGSRLGANEGPLRQVLAQLKMAYAETVMPGSSPSPSAG
jgi:hypothetical protein